jgi:hypothetical protein
MGFDYKYSFYLHIDVHANKKRSTSPMASKNNLRKKIESLDFDEDEEAK